MDDPARGHPNEAVSIRQTGLGSVHHKLAFPWLVCARAPMSDHDIYHRTINALKQAGFALVRDGRHEWWRSEDGKRGVAISYNIRDKNRARSILRSAGIDARL
jgi:hypothetical protein